MGARPIRAFNRAPSAVLATHGAVGYFAWWRPFAAWNGEPYWAYVDGKIADVIDVAGALVVRRSLAEKALRRWADVVVLRPVVIAPFKPGKAPRFDRPPLDEDFAIIDPQLEIAGDRAVLAANSFSPLDAPRERALLTSFDRSPFEKVTAPIFRANELTLDVWVGDAVFAALKRVFGGAIVEGRTRPSVPFADAPSFEPLASTSPRDAYLRARSEGPSAKTRAAALAHPFYAYAYACAVDRGPRDDTRAAAAATVDTAILYALDVDQGGHPVTRAGLADSYRLGEYDERVAALAPAKGRTAGAFTVVGLKKLVEPKNDLHGAFGRRIADGEMTARPKTTAAAKSDWLASAKTGPWLFRRALAEQLFRDVRGVVLRTAKPAGFVFVDVVEDRPLDRDAATATYSDPARPWSAIARTVREPAVLTLPEDELVVARVTEFPSVIVASAALVARWKKGNAPLAPAAAREPMPVFPLWDEGPPFPATQASERDFRAALAGDPTARKKAIVNPWWAYAIARLVDRGPRPDTRRGAIGHPHTAALYARFVDDAPRMDTRRAVLTCAPAALFYARYVDGKLVPATAAVLAPLGYDAAALADD